tara:strand:- start:54 stop:314 length:261 start_codon:yes stop_codon:yes gene_type:complete
MLEKIKKLFKKKVETKIPLPSKCASCPYVMLGRLTDAPTQHVWCGHPVENAEDWKPSFVNALSPPPKWCLLRKEEEGNKTRKEEKG